MCEVRDEDAGEQAEQVAVPRDAPLLLRAVAGAGQHAEDHPAVEHGDEQGDGNRGDAAFVQAAQDEKAEQRERHAAGADVGGAAAEQPKQQSAQNGGGKQHPQQVGHAPAQQHGAEHQKRPAVGQQVGEGAMHEGHAEDAWQAVEPAREQRQVVHEATIYEQAVQRNQPDAAEHRQQCQRPLLQIRWRGHVNAQAATASVPNRSISHALSGTSSVAGEV